MAKRSKDSTQGRRKHFSKAHYFPAPGYRAPGRPKPPTAVRREALYDISGQPYDRDPCPHVRRMRELAVAETFPIKVGDVITYDSPCVRPGAHVREQKMISVPDVDSMDPHRFTTITVPDDDARLHADAAGRTWS